MPLMPWIYIPHFELAGDRSAATGGDQPSAIGGECQRHNLLIDRRPERDGGGEKRVGLDGNRSLVADAERQQEREEARAEKKQQ